MRCGETQKKRQSVVAKMAGSETRSKTCATEHTPAGVRVIDQRCVRESPRRSSITPTLQLLGVGNYDGAITTTIHETPNLSATMPKRSAKNVLIMGCCTWPDSDNDAKTRSASAALGIVSDSENP